MSQDQILNAQETQVIVDAIIRLYPSNETELTHKNEYELLCATVLSAQATDVGVNKATPDLFEAYPSPEKMMEAPLEDIQDKIKTIGLYKNKSKFLKTLSRQLVEDFNGQVPDNREDLMSLAGVGRKTANVVLANGFGIPAFAVDTHVQRVCRRLHMVADTADVLEVETVMTDKLAPEIWHQAHHSILLFGRYQCRARSHDHHACLTRIQSGLEGDPVGRAALEKISQAED